MTRITLTTISITNAIAVYDRPGLTRLKLLVSFFFYFAKSLFSNDFVYDHNITLRRQRRKTLETWMVSLYFSIFKTAITFIYD